MLYILDIDGFLFIGEDTLLFHWNLNLTTNSHNLMIEDFHLETFDLQTKCHTEWHRPLNEFHCTPSYWLPWHIETYINKTKEGLHNMRNHSNQIIAKCYQKLYKNLQGENRVPYKPVIADFFYIPRTAKSEVTRLIEYFAKYDYNQEITLPILYYCLKDMYR